jgi:hypothetical protein
MCPEQTLVALKREVISGQEPTTSNDATIYYLAKIHTIQLYAEKRIRKIMMEYLFLLPFFLLVGCMSVGDMKGLSSGHIGCSPNEITIEDPDSTSITYNWTAICKGKTFICSQDLSGFDQTVSCTERVE